MKDVNIPRPLVFIVGVGRSGTSLVQSMLAAHPKVAFPPETGFIRRFVAKGILSKKYKRHGLEKSIHFLDADSKFKRTRLDSAKLIKKAFERGAGSDGAVYRMMLEEVALREEKQYSGDKDPRAIEYLGLLRDTLPGVHVVHVIRDPRDVLVSKKKAAWSKKHGLFRHVFANRIQVRMGRRLGPRLFGDCYHEIIYERLLADPEVELMKLCEGLGISFEPSMLNFRESAKQLVSEEEMEWKKETLGPLLRKNYEKWKTKLTDLEIALTELVCSNKFVAGGYKYSYRKRNLKISQLLYIYCVALIICTVEPFYWIYRKFTVWRARKYT